MTAADARFAPTRPPCPLPATPCRRTRPRTHSRSLPARLPRRVRSHHDPRPPAPRPVITSTRALRTPARPATSRTCSVGPLRQEGDAHPHGRTRRRWKDDDPLQAQARRDCHHHPHHRYASLASLFDSVGARACWRSKGTKDGSRTGTPRGSRPQASLALPGRAATSAIGVFRSLSRRLSPSPGGL